ncbi:MAG TPA: TetR family transcriptional regulator, partial [Micavibrio sp.]
MAVRNSTKKKTAKKPAISLKDRAVQAALDLAAEKGWAHAAMQDIADASQCSLAELHDVFDARFDILAAYGRLIDRRVLESAGAPDRDAPERDRLFDVMMERFDILNENREAVTSILESFRRDPKQAVISLPHLGQSMAWMLEAAGIEVNGPRGALTVAGLTGVYLYALRAWLEDDSRDMGKTMAALDKAL